MSIINLYCANVHCLYWEEGRCCLDEVYLNAQGVCTDCKLMPMEESLEEKRLTLRDNSELVDHRRGVQQMVDGVKYKNRYRLE